MSMALRWHNRNYLLTTQPGDPSVFQRLDVTDIIERQKEAYLSAFINNEALSTLVLYRSLQPEYRYAHYLSVVQSFPNRRLISGMASLQNVATARLSTCTASGRKRPPETFRAMYERLLQ